MSPSDYEGLHRRYTSLLEGMPGLETFAAPGDDVRECLSSLFRDMMKALFKEKGAEFRVGLVADRAVQEFVGAHASVLDSTFEKVEMSQTMRRRLTRSNYIFSGMKTFHELREAFPSLLDENGNRKPFERFLNDVQKIDATYNRNWLRTEYNFVAASAEMAAKWERFAADGDRYNLQYRTQRDDKVRPEHAALDRVTLPPSDSFWETHWPPLFWGCRCNVVQVRKSKYPTTPHDEAMRRGEAATRKDKTGMFRFNSGLKGKTMPDYNPYTIRKCNTCPVANGNKTGQLARFVPDNEVCAACVIYHRLASSQLNEVPTRQQIKEAANNLSQWYKQKLPAVMVGKFPARRFIVETPDGRDIVIKKNFYEECINKYKDDPMYALKLEYAKRAHEFIAKAKHIGREDSRDHPGADFEIYEFADGCYRIEMKVKCNRDGNFLHILRIYKK